MTRALVPAGIGRVWSRVHAAWLAAAGDRRDPHAQPQRERGRKRRCGPGGRSAALAARQMTVVTQQQRSETQAGRSSALVERFELTTEVP